MGKAVAGIEVDRLLEQPRCLRGSLRIAPGHGIALQHAFIRGQARRRLAAGPDRIGGLDPANERADDRLDHFVLDLEEVGRRAVEAFSPNIAAGLAIDQLRCDPNTLAQPANAAFEDVANIEFMRDPLEIAAGIAVTEGR